MANENAFEFSFENNLEFGRALDRLSRATSDFRIPFGLIGMDFHRSNRKLFTLQGAGLYQDLAESTKKQKQTKLGFVYPILVGQTRQLSNSILGPKNKGSIFTIRRDSLAMGSSVPYGKFHQSDDSRSKLPQRKFVFIDGGPADRSNDSSIAGRRERWINIVDDHVSQLISGSIL